MGYRNLRTCLEDLVRHGRAIRIEDEIDPRLEAAEIHRRVCAAGGPALWFAKVRGSPFEMASNLFGTLERARFLFRDSIDRVRRAIELKIDPSAFFRKPTRYLSAPWTAWNMQPKYRRSGPVAAASATLAELPQLVSWPEDGGPFVTLPLVYTEDPDSPGWRRSNLGMYRVQLGGNRYSEREIGLHYQIHRGIGVHHAAAIRRGEPLKVNVFVGGSPAMILSAVMPLPEGLSELTFAGALQGSRIPLIRRGGELPLYAEADFCISGRVEPGRLLPEGPFGDHLGYYSLTHDFPVLSIDRIYCRPGAIWPFTVVGRPPQEDSAFGALIHELTMPIIPTVIHGVRAVNAVDAAGVHPLLLAVGSERYVPYRDRTSPQELLTQANAILGQGQMSLAKYLWIAAQEDDPNLDPHDIERFLMHILRRVDWRRDLHFQTCTTIDTLDYSGDSLNSGSKLVIAAVGTPVRELLSEIPAQASANGNLLPAGFGRPRIAFPGVIVLEGPSRQRDKESTGESAEVSAGRFCRELPGDSVLRKFPLIVIVDDSGFAAANLANFLWTTFTRSNPASDVHGIGEEIVRKHWGCSGPLVIDARIKPHHAPPLLVDPETSKKVDALASRGGPLGKWL